MSPRNDPVTVVVPGDLHLTNRDQVNFQIATKLLREISELIKPDFVQFIGDNVQDAQDEQFMLFEELRERLSVPYEALVGDHDVVGDPAATAFRRWIGDHYGSTTLRGFRFLRLNTLERPRLGFAPEQLDWLSTEFQLAEKQREHTIIFQHHYPYKVCEQFAGPGIDRWRELVARHRPTAVICGHTHYGQIANDGRNVALCVRSIGDPEGGAPGYLIVHLDGDDLAVTYRTINDIGPCLLITHPRDLLLATDERHIVSESDEVRVRIWTCTPVNTVIALIDQKHPFELSQNEDQSWSGPVDANQLSKGEHQVTVHADLIDGQRCRGQLNFFVDVTCRFTAVPQSSPVVRTTAFC